MQKFWSSLVASSVFFFFSCAFIQQVLREMSFRKPLVCCLTEHFHVFLMYIQEHTTSHAHKVDAVDLCSISKNWDYLDSVSATTSIIASFSVKGYLFPFSMVTCKEQAHWQLQSTSMMWYPDLCSAKPMLWFHGHHGCLFTIISNNS